MEIKIRYVFGHDDGRKDFVFKSIEQIEDIPLIKKTFNFRCIARNLFTGVKDVTGKDIYENDIVRSSYSVMRNEISEVQFKRGIFFVLNNGGYHALSEFMYDSRDKTKDLEVIGNIYENPDLLKES